MYKINPFLNKILAIALVIAVFFVYDIVVPPKTVQAQSVSTRENTLGPGTYTYRVPGVYELTVPDGIYKANIQTWGAGGGGGSGLKISNHHLSGFGGGGGGYSEGVTAVVPGQKLNIIVGAGGIQGEGGSLSEVNIDQVAVAGAGGGGGGLSVGGPGYSSGGSAGILGAIVAVIIIAVVSYFTMGAGSGLAASMTTSFGTGGTATAAGAAGLTTVAESVGVVSTVNGVSMMGAYTITAHTVATSIIGSGIVGSIGAGTAAAGLTTGLANGTIEGVRVAGDKARQTSSIDPRQPGGISGLDGFGFGLVRGGVGAGKGGSWPVGEYSAPPDVGGGQEKLNFIPSLISKVFAFTTFAKEALAQSWQPVSGTGGDSYAGSGSVGSTGGPYSEVGGNSYASSGGAGANGGAGGDRGRRGRDGSGQGGYDVPLSGNAQDGGFPGGGGGGSDTGTGGYGGDGQVVIDFASDGISSGNVPQCRDTKDNDGDGLIDYPIDPGCTTADDNDETDIGSNVAPSAPTLNCPITLNTGQAGAFTAQSTDSDSGDVLSYDFNWGDGGVTSVNGLSSGQIASTNKSWAVTGSKTVTVNVRDSKNATASASCVVNVTPASVNTPSVSIIANPSTVSTGGTSVLTWASIYSTSCTASGGWSGAKTLLGSETTSPINSPTTYTITCTGPDGSASNSVTVTLGGGPSDICLTNPVDPSCLHNYCLTHQAEQVCTNFCSANPLDSTCVSIGGGGGGNGGGGGGGGGGGSVSSGFSLDGDTKTNIRFVSSNGADTDPKNLSVNPVGAFSQDVVVSLLSITSTTSGTPLPTGVTATVMYSVDGGTTYVADPSELMHYDSTGGFYRNTGNLIGLKVKIRFNKPIAEAYNVVFQGTSSGQPTSTHTIIINPGTSPDFREI